MKRIFMLTLLPFLLWTLSCADKSAAPSADNPHATVSLRDGTSVLGKVVSTSSTEVELTGDDGVSRKIPMKLVKSIEYDEAPPAAEASAPPPAAPAAPAATPAAPRPPVAQTTPVQPVQSAPPEAVHETHYHPKRAQIRTRTYELAVGTDIPVRVEETIDSSKAVEGQTYAAEVTEDVRDAAGEVVIPRGSNAQILINSASKGGKIKGQADLALDLRSVSVEGQEYRLSTSDIQQKGTSGVGANRRTAEYTGGGTAIGAIIGAIAGGGKGAAIGAGAGAGAGVLTQIFTRGKTIKVPAETILTFKLDQALRVQQAQ